MNIVGIDLGTTFSCIASLNSIGKPEIVPNADGERITPSVIYIQENSNDEALVGVEAINARYVEKSRCARWVKRDMGEAEYPSDVAGKKWKPAELASFILKKIKEDCASQVGEISHAVITVPAYFDEIRRNATMDAGILAGLNVVGIINEPTAALLYYVTKHDISGRVLIFDLGGGTFDVTIADVSGRKIDIVCSGGDHKLGGYDFDQKILQCWDEAYKKKPNGKTKLRMLRKFYLKDPQQK
jgi:molecular chaperone DnaK